MSLLTLHVNPKDAVALRFLLGQGSGDCRAPQYRKVAQKAREAGTSVRDALDACIAGSQVIKGTSNLQETYQQIQHDLGALAGMQPKQIVDHLFPACDDDTEVLRSAALLFLQGKPGSDVKGLWDHIDNLLTQPEMPEAGDFVRIMSLHKSKGLTSRVTIIASCVQGVIPMAYSEDNTFVTEREFHEEQRRLFYVAVTRAKDLLVLSSFSQIDVALALNIGAATKAKRRTGNVETITTEFWSELGSSKPTTIPGAHLNP